MIHQTPRQTFLQRASERAWRRFAAKTFVFTVIGVVLYIAHAAFVPVALALLLAVVLSGPVETLHKRRVPRFVSASLILVITLSLIGGTAHCCGRRRRSGLQKLPRRWRRSAQSQSRHEIFGHIDDLRKTASNMGPPAKASTAPAVAVVAQQSAPSLIIGTSGAIAANLMTFLIVALFLLTGGPPMLARMTAAFVDDLDASHVLTIIEKVRQELGRFYLTTTLINIGLGVITGLAMWGWGMPHALLVGRAGRDPQPTPAQSLH